MYILSVYTRGKIVSHSESSALIYDLFYGYIVSNEENRRFNHSGFSR